MAQQRIKMVIDKRMPKGFNGAISRVNSSFCESAHIKYDNIPNYGTAVKYEDNFLVALSEGDTADKIVGFFPRIYPSHSFDELTMLTNSSGEFNFTGNVMKRGYMTVYIESPTEVKRGDPVYIRIDNATENSPLGAVLTTATDAVLLPDAYFVSGADNENIAEISYKI